MKIDAASLLSFIFIVVSGAPAHAIDLAEESQYSTTQFQQSVYANGDLGGSEDEDTPFAWNLNYSYQRTVTPNGGAPSIVDNTTSYTGGVNWSGDSEFGLDAKINYAGTPDENLTVVGGQLTGSYRWVYGSPRANKFSPYLYFRFLAADEDYVENYSGQVPRKKNTPKRVVGTSELRQDMFGFDVKWKPFKAWKFDFEIDQYLYNRSVAEFEAQLDSATSLQRGMGSFTETVGGVARVTYSLGITWEFFSDWRLAVSEQFSFLAADNSASTTFRAAVTDEFAKDWYVTGGWIREESVLFSDNLAVLGVECDL